MHRIHLLFDQDLHASPAAIGGVRTTPKQRAGGATAENRRCRRRRRRRRRRPPARRRLPQQPIRRVILSFTHVSISWTGRERCQTDERRRSHPCDCLSTVFFRIAGDWTRRQSAVEPRCFRPRATTVNDGAVAVRTSERRQLLDSVLRTTRWPTENNVAVLAADDEPKAVFELQPVLIFSSFVFQFLCCSVSLIDCVSLFSNIRLHLVPHPLNPRRPDFRLQRHPSR